MTFELGRALLVSGAVSTESLAEALLEVCTQRMPLARALVHVRAVGERRLEEELARSDAPTARHVRPVPELMASLPPGICLRLAAVPIHNDPDTGVVDVAVLDPTDAHAADEIGYHLSRPVRIVRASLDAIRDALELYPATMRSLAPPMSQPPRDDSETRRHLEDIPIPLSRRVDAFRPSSAWTGEMIGQTVTIERPMEDVQTEPVFDLRAPPSTVRDAEPSHARRHVRGPTPSFPLRAPLALRMPISPNAPSPPFVDSSAFLPGIESATDRDVVIGLVLMGMRAVARKVAILLVRKDAFVGWTCTPEFGDEAELRDLTISTARPTLLTPMLHEVGTYLGPLHGAVAKALLRVMKTATDDVAITPVRVAGRATLVLVADELGDTTLATQRIEELARTAGAALERILRTKRA